MSERLDDIYRREAAVAAAFEAVGGGYELGTITIAYDGDYPAQGAVWIRSTCSDCEATMVMAATHELHLRQLALDTARYQCPKFGHEQDVVALIKQSSTTAE